MKYILVLLLISGCSAERTLVKENPIIATGTVSVFVATIIGLSGS